jgi:hypothetical protein
MKRRVSNAAIVAGIAETSSILHAPQDTAYFAAKFGYSPRGMLLILNRLAAADLLIRHPRLCYGMYTWEVAP